MCAWYQPSFFTALFCDNFRSSSFSEIRGACCALIALGSRLPFVYEEGMEHSLIPRLLQQHLALGTLMPIIMLIRRVRNIADVFTGGTEGQVEATLRKRH